MNNEEKFKQISNDLDEALERDKEHFLSDGIIIDDSSTKSYHYKAMSLEWLYKFSKEDLVNYERVYCQIILCFKELELPNKNISVRLNGSVYSEGQPSKAEVKRSKELSINQLLNTGIYNFIASCLKDAKSDLEESM